MKKINKLSLLSIVYIFIASLFFVISLKFSGAEAYHHTGVTAYIKWMILGFLLNIGYLIPITKLGSRYQLVTLPLMVFAVLVNATIYSNPKHLVIYDILSVLLFSIALVLIIKKDFNYGQNIYAQRRS